MPPKPSLEAEKGVSGACQTEPMYGICNPDKTGDWKVCKVG